MAQASPGHVGRWTCKLKSAQTSANLRIEPGEKKSVRLSRRLRAPKSRDFSS